MIVDTSRSTSRRTVLTKASGVAVPAATSGVFSADNVLPSTAAVLGMSVGSGLAGSAVTKDEQTPARRLIKGLLGGGLTYAGIRTMVDPEWQAGIREGADKVRRLILGVLGKSVLGKVAAAEAGADQFDGAYIEGFCKAASLLGVDPSSLAKKADAYASPYVTQNQHPALGTAADMSHLPEDVQRNAMGGYNGGASNEDLAAWYGEGVPMLAQAIADGYVPNMRYDYATGTNALTQALNNMNPGGYGRLLIDDLKTGKLRRTPPLTLSSRRFSPNLRSNYVNSAIRRGQAENYRRMAPQRADVAGYMAARQASGQATAGRSVITYR